MKRLNIRLIVAIITSLLDEAAIIALALWGLAAVGVYTPLWAVVLLVSAFAAFAIFSYRVGSVALAKPPLLGQATMIGMTGRVVVALAPEGMVRVQGEWWQAITEEDSIRPGEEVTVVGQERLMLTVIRRR